MSIYIFLIFSDNSILEVIVLHCDFCIPKLISQSSNETIEVIQKFLAPLLKNNFKSVNHAKMCLFRILWEREASEF